MGKYVTINSHADLKKLASENKYVLIDFWATWCPPCKLIAPTFEKWADEFTSEGHLAFAKVDVDEQSAVAQEYAISAMPTFILLKDGEPVGNVRGALQPKIKALVDQALGDKPAGGDSEEATVSGSYTMSSNSNWKTAL